ncbi:MAG TPA: hypothetical protein VGK16_02310 [Candidatus Limnocylindrales bacterium]|jgi:hypothetical protein
MWSEIVLERDPDGALSAITRARLMSRPAAEAEAAVAYVAAREAELELHGENPDRLEAAREAFGEAQRVRELLRVRAYSLETERVWAGLPTEDRGLILGRLGAAGQPATPAAASTVIGMALNQLVVARLIALATATKGSQATAGEAMLGLPIAFQLEVISETGADLRVPGEVLRVLGL